MFLLGDRRTSDPAIYDSAIGRWYTYLDLYTSVSELAEALRSDRKKLVFLYCENNPITVLVYMAAIEAGHAIVLLDRGLLSEFREVMFRMYLPDFVFGVGEEQKILAGARYLEGKSSNAFGDVEYWSCQESGHLIHSDLALMLSTSGSTGNPKCVRLTRGNIESNARSISSALDITSEDRPLVHLPCHYSYGLSVINSHLSEGASIVMTGHGVLQPELWQLCRTMECTSFAGVPYTYEMLSRLKISSSDYPSLRTMTQAGGRLRTELACAFHSDLERKQGKFYVMYGQTEATARISCLPPHMLRQKLGSVGLVIPDGRIAVDSDESGQGEIVYSGPNVMMGYAESRDELSRGNDLKGILHTGDIGKLDDDGYLFLSGRSKRISKIFGLRVNLDDIEIALKGCGPVAVISKDESIVVFCEAGTGVDASLERMKLARQFKINYKAFEFRGIDRLPQKSNGKVDYLALESEA